MPFTLNPLTGMFDLVGGSTLQSAYDLDPTADPQIVTTTNGTTDFNLRTAGSSTVNTVGFNWTTGTSTVNNSGGMSWTTGNGTSSGGFQWFTGTATDDMSGGYLWQIGDSAGDGGFFDFVGSDTPVYFSSFIIQKCSVFTMYGPAYNVSIGKDAFNGGTGGISFSNSANINMGLIQEAGQLISLGLNCTQFGSYVDTGRQGGIFRMDTRADIPIFSVRLVDQQGLTFSAGSEVSVIQISSVTGDMGLGAGIISDANTYAGGVHIIPRVNVTALVVDIEGNITEPAVKIRDADANVQIFSTSTGGWKIISEGITTDGGNGYNVGNLIVDIINKNDKCDLIWAGRQDEWRFRVVGDGTAYLYSTLTCSGLVLNDGYGITIDSPTGSVIGQAGSKIGFFGTTAIVQPVNTVAINDVLVNLGFRASGGTSNFSTTLKPRTGTTTANTAPILFTTGSNLTTAVAGAMEYSGSELYFSPSTTRFQFAFIDRAQTWTAVQTLNNVTFTDATNITVSSSTGTKIGTATSQRLGFWNAAPTTQTTGSTDILAGLVTIGLRASSSNPPLNMGTGALTCGNVACSQITITDANNIVIGTTTGTKFGTGTTQKLGFWNATPVVQNTGWGSITNVTTDRVYDANATTVDELADVLGTLIAQLVSYGILGA